MATGSCAALRTSGQKVRGSNAYSSPLEAPRSVKSRQVHRGMAERRQLCHLLNAFCEIVTTNISTLIAEQRCHPYFFPKAAGALLP